MDSIFCVGALPIPARVRGSPYLFSNFGAGIFSPSDVTCCPSDVTYWRSNVNPCYIHGRKTCAHHKLTTDSFNATNMHIPPLAHKPPRQMNSNYVVAKQNNVTKIKQPTNAKQIENSKYNTLGLMRNHLSPTSRCLSQKT